MSESNEKKLLKVHEGLRLQLYRDTKGYATLGYGRNVETKGCSEPEASMMLDNDLFYFRTQLEGALPFFHTLDEVRQTALLSMSFMGVKSFLGFNKLFAAIERQDWQAARKEVLNSDWAATVHTRADDVADMIETGKWPSWMHV